jgi:hypothetical protein
MIRSVALLLFASIAWGQVQVTYIPEDVTVTRKIAGQKVGMQLWNVILSNRGPAPANFSALDVLMAIPDLGPISTPRAKRVLKQSESRKKGRIFADVLGGLSLGYTVGTATELIKMANSKEIATAAAGVSLGLRLVAPEAKRRADDERFDQSWLLEGDIYLRSMQTVEGAIFTRLLPPEKLKYRVVTLSLHVHGQPASPWGTIEATPAALWRTTLINNLLELKLAKF